MTPFVVISMLLFFALGICLLWREGLLKDRTLLIFCVLLMAGVLILRYFLLDYESDDYQRFLAPWVQFFRDHGGLRGLSEPIGNYNLPYLYFLALFSYLDINDLYLIKLLSVLFDVLLAWACLKLASLFIQDKSRLAVCFFAVLFLPTVVLNGAYWGQCDSIYCFFAVFSLYLALNDKPVGAMFAITASFAFKLQAVFLMPVFFVLCVAKKIHWKHLLIFPAAYIIYMLPALLAGRPFADTITLYFHQAGTVGEAMNYNAPSLTSMFTWSGDTQLWSRLLILAAFVFVLVVFAAAICQRRRLNKPVLFAFALLFAVGIPYLLPHMHDRYFFPAGALCTVLAFCTPKYFVLPLLAELASLHCYYAYFSGCYLFEPRIGGAIMLVVFLLLILYTEVQLKNSKNSENYP